MKIINSKWFERMFLTMCWILLILMTIGFLAVGSFIFALLVSDW